MDNLEYFDLPVSGLAPKLPPKESAGADTATCETPLNPATPVRPPIPPKTSKHARQLQDSQDTLLNNFYLEENGNDLRRDRNKLSLNISGLNQSDLENSNLSLTGYRNTNLNDNQPYIRRDFSSSPERKLSVSSDISDKVNKFEALANSPETSRETSPKNLWFYKDGLRTPTTPPPVSSKMVLNLIKSEPPPPDTMPDSRPHHISTAQLTLSPRSARAKINSESEMAKSVSSLAVTLSNGSHMTTSFTKKSSDGDIDSMSRSLGSLSFNNSNSYSPLKLSSLASEGDFKSDNPMNNNSIPSPKYPERPHNPPPIPPSRIKNCTTNISTNLALPVLAPNSSKPPPPPLPPKQSKEKTPPPRPVSKELKLDDILSMCAEYERQIEAEQKEAYALSPFQQTPIVEIESEAATATSIKTEKPANVTIDSVQSPSLGPLSPSSPGSTLQPPRIKTNGSLPRDGKRLPSPSRSLPPNSPHLFSNSENEISGIFTFEKQSCVNNPGSPVLASSFTRLGSIIPPRSPLENCNGSPSNTLSTPVTGQHQISHQTTPCNSSSTPNGYLTHPSSASPRTRIRTTLGRSSLCSQNSSSETLKETSSANNSPAHTMRTNQAINSPTQFSLVDYQGGKEGMADTDKSKEELYIEAKEILALVSQSPTESPSSTGPRKPPRSKHDFLDDKPNVDVMPSSEAHNRLLIGTVMLSKNSISGTHIKSPESLTPQITAEYLKIERTKALEEVNKAAKEIAELSIAIEEAERSVDLEKSLIGAEKSGQEAEVEKMVKHIEKLKEKESQLTQNLKSWRIKNNAEIVKARGRLENAESELDRLEERQKTCENLNTDEEMELLEKIKKSHEHLEAERRIFEDLEFKHMEEEAGMEAEIEDVSREVNETQQSIDIAETTVNEMEHQKLEISVNQDISIMQEKRDNVGKQLEREKEKLTDLEKKLRQLLTITNSHRSSEDSGTITWSDEETVHMQDSTTKVHGVWSRNHMNSAGSDHSSESTSDLPQDSTDSQSPSPAAVRVRRNRAAIPTPSPENLSQRPRRSSKKLSSVDILSSCDESRPLSTDTARWSGGGDLTDASSWVGGVLRRGASSRAGQRPLTRYLPVTTQENFDLRSHIETAGHQIELCKHIILNSCSCRGYLNKMGARFKSWNKRWFVFDRNKRTLVYYADKSENKAKGGIYFHSISEVYVDHQNAKSVSQRVTFCMKTNDRKYYLMAPSPEAMRIWVDVLFTGAEGYLEFQD